MLNSAYFYIAIHLVVEKGLKLGCGMSIIYLLFQYKKKTESKEGNLYKKSKEKNMNDEAYVTVNKEKALEEGRKI